VSDHDGVSDEVLPGGYVNTVVRVGDTVRRPPALRPDLVRDLLRLFEAHHWPAAPRFLGVDDTGRDVLSFVEGHVAWEPQQLEAVCSDASLVRIAQLVRQFHDLTAGSPLARGEEVVCHNDLSPRNTVYRDHGAGLRPVAIIDWDIAAPGQRIHDVAHVCWQFANLGPEITDVQRAGNRIRLIADAYELEDRPLLIETIVWWQDRCWRGIDAAADRGDPAMSRLRDLGAVAEVRAAHDWTAQHRGVLEHILR
jgi:phosphotransferase family enzyme